MTDSPSDTTIRRMIVISKTSIGAIAGILMLAMGASAAYAEDQAKTIINSLDPKTMNELLSMVKSQPDAALTNIMPIAANKFRFLFVWPASNTIMTQERIGRSFAERFILFAEQRKLLATAYCLTSKTMFFGRSEYGGEDFDVAYRDIEVRYQFGLKTPCAGKYIAAAELEQPETPVRPQKQGYNGGFSLPPPPPAQPVPAEEGLKPFLKSAPATP